MSAALAFIKRFEGLHDGDRRTPILEPARCPAGIWTLGWGAIFDGNGARVSAGTAPISIAEAEGLLARDFAIAAEKTRALSCPAILKDGQIVALASFVYNLGAGAYRGSTLRQRVREGDDEGAAAEFPRWVMAGGIRLPGLVRRRAAEAALYLGKDGLG